jgi:hypothetical protein
MGTSWPSALRITRGRFTTGWPVSKVCLKTQAAPQALARKTSEQGRPKTAASGTPVISWAAWLKKVIRQSRSTVNTPSAMLSRMLMSGGGRLAGERGSPESTCARRLDLGFDSDFVFGSLGIILPVAQPYRIISDGFDFQPNNGFWFKRRNSLQLLGAFCTHYFPGTDHGELPFRWWA